jgi:hypothetical protein
VRFLHSKGLKSAFKNSTMTDQQLSHRATPVKSQLQNKSEHLRTNKCTQAVSAEVLKTAEIRMQQKGMLPGNNSLNHHPLWFFVETEKNVFLWRSGLQLDDKEEFDFWVDLETLIEKRLSQIERSKQSDPIQFAFSEFEINADPKAAEKDYLLALKENIMPILNHLSALSEVQREIIAEGTKTKATQVVLPHYNNKVAAGSKIKVDL